ncbi:TPA: hypothetical protein QCX34_000006 [Bacillus anthracis]|uniref:Uncharacterized protein n=1 Tax=Bacillus cereus TaxID=1396 RepID=A0A164IKW4_BACCE|nr:hypothetical protein [Bacillus cereus]KZD41589.1 hypothetical protein B4082_0224 [Bacillus cereus]MCU5342833.1 hypothetical protein [Bacillus cereus]HDR7432616.1 hypothetical protein [Bacillus anthracis]
MQTIEIHTQGGLKHKVQTEVYNAEVLNTKLNDNDLITVLIGDFIIQRIDVKRIIPLNTIDVEGAKTVEVHTNAGKVIEINTNDYDPIYLNEQLNNNNTITVVIGDYIFSRIDVKQVVPVPVKEESKEPEKPPVTVPEQPTDQVTPPITEEPPGETGEGSTTVSQTEPTE